MEKEQLTVGSIICEGMWRTEDTTTAVANLYMDKGELNTIKS